ncbi:fimbrial protein [Providencia stuartii]|uniref:fimbrial protein n=1 Tax=Providencia stuartii TaxID=588 RepID=UPI00370A49D3
MFNQKNMIALCVAAGLGFAGAASAGQNAEVNVSGQIAAATCDLSVSNPNIDLGTHISADITAAGDIASSAKDFTLQLTNCSKDQTGASVQLFAKGTALDANGDYFNNTANATVGVKLTADSKPVKPNTSVDLTSVTGLAQGSSASIAMNVGLYSTVGTPASQRIDAPITFSVSYE